MKQVIFTGHDIMDYHYQGNKSELIEKMLMMNKMEFITLSAHKKALRDQKQKIREWLKDLIQEISIEQWKIDRMPDRDNNKYLKEFDELKQ